MNETTIISKKSTKFHSQVITSINKQGLADVFKYSNYWDPGH